MSLYPLFARLDGKPVLVVGGGTIAERKVSLLLGTGACIRVRALAFTPALQGLARQGRVACLEGHFAPQQLDDVWLAVAATDDEAVNRAVAQAAEARRIFVNVVDDAELSSVHTPAIIDRDPLLIAISSAGAAPMIARALREDIEARLDAGLGPLAQLAQRHRARIRQARPDLDERRRFYEGLLQGEALRHARAGRTAEAEAALLGALGAGAVATPGSAVVVTAPGSDTGNLTLAGLRALNRADTLFIESTVHGAHVELARRDAERVAFTAPTPAQGSPLQPIRAAVLAQVRAGQAAVIVQARADPARLDEDEAFFSAHAVRLHGLPAATGIQ